MTNLLGYARDPIARFVDDAASSVCVWRAESTDQEPTLIVAKGLETLATPRLCVVACHNWHDLSKQGGLSLSLYRSDAIPERFKIGNGFGSRSALQAWLDDPLRYLVSGRAPTLPKHWRGGDALFLLEWCHASLRRTDVSRILETVEARRR